MEKHTLETWRGAAHPSQPVCVAALQTRCLLMGGRTRLRHSRRRMWWSGRVFALGRFGAWPCGAHNWVLLLAGVAVAALLGYAVCLRGAQQTTLDWYATRTPSARLRWFFPA